jgi:hypothetical protein
VIREKVFLFNEMFEEDKLTSIKCNLVILATYMMIEADLGKGTGD